MKKVNVPCWETSDQKLFTDRKLADEHQFRIDLGELVSSLSWGRGGEWSSDMLVGSIVENRHKFTQLFCPGVEDA